MSVRAVAILIYLESLYVGLRTSLCPEFQLFVFMAEVGRFLTHQNDFARLKSEAAGSPTFVKTGSALEKPPRSDPCLPELVEVSRSLTDSTLCVR